MTTKNLSDLNLCTYRVGIILIGATLDEKEINKRIILFGFELSTMSMSWLIAGIVALVFFVIALSTAGRLTRETPPGDGTSGGGGGCYLNDAAFSDVTSVTSADVVLSKVSGNFKEILSKKDQISMMISKSIAQGVNPAVVIGIWAGEQGYKNDDAALGYGIYAGSTNRYVGFEKQVDGALGVIKKSMTNTAPYNAPAGENIFTRLFYNYTGAMKAIYDSGKHYVADGTNARIVVMKILAPSQVTCLASVALVGGSSPQVPKDGHVFPLAKTTGYSDSFLGNRCGGTGSGRPHAHGGIDIMHAKDEHVPVYAVVDGTIFRINTGSIRLQSTNPNDHYTYFYQHLYQVLVTKGQVVKAGDLIAYSGGHNAGSVGDHTHFGMMTSPSAEAEVPISSCSINTSSRASIASQMGIVNPYKTLKNWQN